LGYKKKKNIGAFVGSDSDEVAGVNNQNDLVAASKILHQRLCKIT